MKTRGLSIVLAALILTAAGGWAYYQKVSAGAGMTTAAEKFLASLDKDQRATAQMEYGNKARVGWHFIPKKERKGLQIRDMNEAQRKAAHALLRAALSQVGYDKATVVMRLESILNLLEKGKGAWKRDPVRYYFTVLGKPSNEGKWGLSVEGHHLSLNFVVEGGKIVSSTPQFYGANPGVVKGDYGFGIKKGTRVLALEETLAFKLVNSLSDEQRKVAVIAEKAPRDIRAAGTAQPPTDPAVGLPVTKMSREQRGILRQLVREYIAIMPEEVATARRQAIRKGNPREIHFAWAGARKPGVGHYYRIQGPTFLIEFCKKSSKL